MAIIGGLHNNPKSKFNATQKPRRIGGENLYATWDSLNIDANDLDTDNILRWSVEISF